MADHELIDDSERDRFAGTSAMSPGTTVTATASTTVTRR